MSTSSSSEIALFWVRYGDRLLQRRGAAEAADAYYVALGMNPYNPLIYRRLVSTLIMLGQYQEALALCEDLIALDPQDARSYGCKGDILSFLQRQLEARDAYIQAIRCNPRCFEAYNNLGVLLCEMEHFEEAWLCFELGLQLLPVDPTLSENLNGALAEVERQQAPKSAPTGVRGRPFQIDEADTLKEERIAWEDIPTLRHVMIRLR